MSVRGWLGICLYIVFFFIFFHLWLKRSKNRGGTVVVLMVLLGVLWIFFNHIWLSKIWHRVNIGLYFFPWRIAEGTHMSQKWLLRTSHTVQYRHLYKSWIRTLFKINMVLYEVCLSLKLDFTTRSLHLSVFYYWQGFSFLLLLCQKFPCIVYVGQWLDSKVLALMK